MQNRNAVRFETGDFGDGRSRVKSGFDKPKTVGSKRACRAQMRSIKFEFVWLYCPPPCELSRRITNNTESRDNTTNRYALSGPARTPRTTTVMCNRGKIYKYVQIRNHVLPVTTGCLPTTRDSLLYINTSAYKVMSPPRKRG